jgi:short-subunit dehydrogenase
MVSTSAIEITDAVTVRDWILACDAIAPLDMVIANAGRSAGTGDGPESAAQVATLVETNIGGTVNTVLPAAERMRSRQRGHIVIVSSLAARLPFPSTPTYSATKAFVRSWGLALRSDLVRNGVRLTIVSPGYIATPMTAGNHFRMPFLRTADQAAAHILRRLDRGPVEIAFPFGAIVALHVLSLLPAGLFGRLMSRGPRKHALMTER